MCKNEKTLITLGSIHKHVSVMFNIKFTLSGGGGLGRDIWHMTESHCIPSQELLLLTLLLVLLAMGMLNDLPGLTSCHCDNIGLVSLILLGWELRVLYYHRRVAVDQTMVTLLRYVIGHSVILNINTWEGQYKSAAKDCMYCSLHYYSTPKHNYSGYFCRRKC